MVPVQNSLGGRTFSITQATVAPEQGATSYNVITALDSFSEAELSTKSKPLPPAASENRDSALCVEKFQSYGLRLLSLTERVLVEKLIAEQRTNPKTAEAACIGLMREVDTCIEGVHKALPDTRRLWQFMLEQGGIPSSALPSADAALILKAYPIANYPEATLQMSNSAPEVVRLVEAARTLLTTWQRVVALFEQDQSIVSRENITAIIDHIADFNAATKIVQEQNGEAIQSTLIDQAVAQRKEHYRQRRSAEVDPALSKIATQIEANLRRHLWVLGGERALEKLDDELWKIHPAMEIVSSLELGRRLLRDEKFILSGRQGEADYERERVAFQSRLERDMVGEKPNFDRAQKALKNIAERLLVLRPWEQAEQLHPESDPAFVLVLEISNYTIEDWRQLFSDPSEAQRFVTGTINACISWLPPKRRAEYYTLSQTLFSDLSKSSQAQIVVPRVVMALSELHDEMLLSLGQHFILTNAAGLRGATIEHDQKELRRQAYPKAQKWWASSIDNALSQEMISFRALAGPDGVNMTMASGLLNLLTRVDSPGKHLPETLRHDALEFMNLRQQTLRSIERLAGNMTRKSGRSIEWAQAVLKDELLWQISNSQICQSMYRGTAVDGNRLQKHPHFAWYTGIGCAGVLREVLKMGAPIHAFHARHQEVHGNFYAALSSRHRDAMVRRFLEWPEAPDLDNTPALLRDVHPELVKLHASCHKIAVVSASVALWEQFITSRLGVWADKKLNDHLELCEQVAKDFSGSESLDAAVAAVPLDVPGRSYAPAPSFHLPAADVKKWLAKAGLSDGATLSLISSEELAAKLGKSAPEFFGNIAAKIGPQTQATLRRMGRQTEVIAKVTRSALQARSAWPGTRLAQEEVVNLFVPVPEKPPHSVRTPGLEALPKQMDELYHQVRSLFQAPKSTAHPITYFRLGRCRDQA